MSATCSSMKVHDGRIHFYDFWQHATFTDPDYPVVITDEVRDELKDMHPSKFVAVGTLGMMIYKVKYSYSTKSGNYKECESISFSKKEISLILLILTNRK